MGDRTRLDILKAFNRLIEKKPFEKITVTDIIAEAEVSKATFYRYFKDKYDVMNYNYKRLLDSSVRLEECHSYRDLYYQLYVGAQKNFKPIRKVFESTGINSFSRFVFDYSRNFALEVTKQNRNGEGFTPEEELLADVYCWGITYMYRKWTYNEYSLSADEAADILWNMMPETLKYYWLTDGKSKT